MFINLIRTNLKTLLLGDAVEQFTWTESTNKEAWKLIDEGCVDGTVVITDKQTNGKGRDGRKWYSVPGRSLTTSIILKPNMDSKLAGWFPLLTGVSICNALKEFGVQAGLKWPNDIYVHSKKLGGILCESKVRGNKIKTVVIGIGLNVNEQQVDLPEYLPATSFFLEKGRTIQRELLLTEILNKMDPVYLNFREQCKPSRLIRLWTDRCIHMNQTIKFKTRDETLTGQFVGINDEGSAIIQLKNKEIECTSGDIHIKEIKI